MSVVPARSRRQVLRGCGKNVTTRTSTCHGFVVKMESRSKKILNLVVNTNSVEGNNRPEYVTANEEVPGCSRPRHDSSSSSSSSSGPSFYEDSDDSVKDPNYQIIMKKSRIDFSSEDDSEYENGNRPIAKTVMHITQTEEWVRNETIINTIPNSPSPIEKDNMNDRNNVENEEGMRQEMMNAIESIMPADRITPTYDTQESTPIHDTENQSTSTSVDIEATEDPTPTKKGKKRPINKENWKKNIAKKLRNCGKSYVSNVTKKIIPVRQLGEPCKETCIYKCRENIPEEQRRQILNDYWNLGQIEKQWSFIASSVEDVVPKCRYVKVDPEGKVMEPKRTNNNAFYLVSLCKKIRVCKTFFKSTLAINNRPITTALNKKNKQTNITSMKDNRGCHGHQPKINENIKEDVKRFIDSIPKIESHYARAHSKRNFIDGSKTIADLHHDYAEICKSKNVPHVNYVMFYRIFTQDFNISFFTQKKDMCDVCEAYKNSSPEEKEAKKDDYETHHKEKKLSRLEKDRDKSDRTLTVCVYDLQAVFQCPKGEISVFYYKSKLNVFNLSVYDIQKNIVDCYVWDEANANRGVNEIGTCVFKYLEKIAHSSEDVNVVFYSDNCAGQQKNKFMVAMYLLAVQKFPSIKSITHKYLIRGHTQNEGDSAHSQIERQVRRELRSGPMYTPDSFIGAIKSARKKSEPFRVNEMCFEDFYDWKNVCSQMSFIIQKDDENIPVKISEVKIVKVMKEDARAIYFKKSYADENYRRAIVIKKRREIDVDVKKAYTGKPGISERKKADLMELINKNMIPRYYRSFYESL